MIIEPPGQPSASTGRPSLNTIVGLIELRGRLPPSTRLGWVRESKLKSVSSLLSRNPKPGTTIPLPPVDSIVNVYVTTFPAVGHGQVGRGAGSVRWPRGAAGAPPWNGYGSPGGTGLVGAVPVIRARRPPANLIRQQPQRRHVEEVGSPR